MFIASRFIKRVIHWLPCNKLLILQIHQKRKKCLKLNLLIGHLAISISWSSLCVYVQKALFRERHWFLSIWVCASCPFPTAVIHFRFHGSQKIRLINDFWLWNFGIDRHCSCRMLISSCRLSGNLKTGHNRENKQFSLKHSFYTAAFFRKSK